MGLLIQPAAGFFADVTSAVSEDSEDNDDDDPPPVFVATDETAEILHRAHISTSYVCEEKGDEFDVASSFRCACKLNSGIPCISRFTVQEIVDHRRMIAELSNGTCKISHF